MNNLEALLADHGSVLYNALDCDCCAYYHNGEPCIYEFRMCEQGYREWLLAEHVDDQPEPAPLLRDYNEFLSESDSREKLEAEIDDWCAEHFNSSFSGKAFNLMLRWLDRQAAITERETEKKWSCFSDSAGGHIAKLERERDRYRELCGKLLDAADDMRRVRDQFDAFTEVN